MIWTNILSLRDGLKIFIAPSCGREGTLAVADDAIRIPHPFLVL